MPLPHVPLVVGEGVGAGVVTEQNAEPVPQYPHCEQQRRGLEQAPFPTEPLPQVPPEFGTGVGEERVGEAVVGFVEGSIGARVGDGRVGVGTRVGSGVGYGVG